MLTVTVPAEARSPGTPPSPASASAPPAAWATGAAADGEVEDYAITLTAPTAVYVNPTFTRRPMASTAT